MKETIKKLMRGESLSRAESYHLFSVFDAAPVEQKAAVMTLLSQNGETVEEIVGFRDYIFEQSSLPLAKEGWGNLIDMVGTGGDGVGTFNISTASSLLVASCGVRVAKHGGRSVTSQSGSTDVVEQLGIPFCQNYEELLLNLTKYHYVYIAASSFNTVLKQYGIFRKNLSFPTIFNLLGPLLNPLQPKRQVIGVYQKKFIPIMIEVLKKLGSEHAMVVHSEDGLDEISVSSETYVSELRDGKVSDYVLSPEDFGFKRHALKEVKGGSAEENAAVIRGILCNQIQGAKLEIVLLNAAAGLMVAGAVDTLQEGIMMAREAIYSKKTESFLAQMCKGE